MTRIKFCGLTRIEDIHAAVMAGADAIGLVFYPGSKRFVTPAQARELLRAIPPFVCAVGLFADAEVKWIHRVLAEVALDQLQFHGRESAAFCRQFGRRWLKAVPMNDLPDAEAVQRYIRDFPDAGAFLFDAFGKDNTGGSGQTFDRSRLPALDVPVIIAGGLTPENVANIVSDFRPFAVDVSSGVESAPGIKSSAKMHAFSAAVRQNYYD